VDLDPIDQRVLGSLLEKERTVPATYPLTLNALRSACNQTSGRDPITDLGDHDVLASIDRLKGQGLARIVHAGTGSRATKYRQVLDERLGLDAGERAVVTLLLLRGPQTPGELRSRAERLHRFRELDDVDAALRSLAEREEPLVEEQERRPGQKERRWSHRLGPSAAATAAPPSPLASVPAVPAAAEAPMDVGSLVDDPSDGWLLVRVAADEVDRTLVAVARALGPDRPHHLSVRSPDDVLDIVDVTDGRLYVVDREGPLDG
jgi:uncharacterized protein YceH (UPF0502 family)